MVSELKSFVDVLKDVRRGDVIADLSVELHDLVQAVRATGGAGEIVLKLKIKPASKGDVNVLMLEDDIKVKLPKSPKGTTVLYATDDNTLQRKDPRQPELTGLRTAGTVTHINDREAGQAV